MVAQLFVARWQDVGVIKASGKLEHRQVSDEFMDDDTVTTTNSALPVTTTGGSVSSSSKENATPQSTAVSDATTTATSTRGTTLKTSRKNGSTTRGPITSFPSATATAPASSTMGSEDCPSGYLWYHCADHNNQFLFDGCCNPSYNPCQHNGYCPRWAFAIAAGQPNTYKLTVNKAFAYSFSDAVMTSIHNGKAEAFTVDGPFATTVYPPATHTTAVASADSHGGVSGGAAAGIAVGVVAGAFIIVGALLFWFWRRRQAKAEAAPNPGDAVGPGVGMPVMAQSPYAGYDSMFGDTAPPYLPYYDEASKIAAGLGGEQLADNHTPHEPVELPGTSAVTASELPGNPVDLRGHDSK